MYSLFFLYLSEQIYKIMKIKLLLIGFLLAANALGAAAQVSKTYYVSKPGTLISMMTEEEANSVTHLTLTGRKNPKDFLCGHVSRCLLWYFSYLLDCMGHWSAEACRWFLEWRLVIRE